jgi:hypothetical protein
VLRAADERAHAFFRHRLVDAEADSVGDREQIQERSEVVSSRLTQSHELASNSWEVLPPVHQSQGKSLLTRWFERAGYINPVFLFTHQQGPGHAAAYSCKELTYMDLTPCNGSALIRGSVRIYDKNAVIVA